MIICTSEAAEVPYGTSKYPKLSVQAASQSPDWLGPNQIHETKGKYIYNKPMWWDVSIGFHIGDLMCLLG